MRPSKIMGCTGRRKAKQKTKNQCASTIIYSVWDVVFWAFYSQLPIQWKKKRLYQICLVAVQRLDELAQIRLVDVPAANIWYMKTSGCDKRISANRPENFFASDKIQSAYTLKLTQHIPIRCSANFKVHRKSTSMIFFIANISQSNFRRGVFVASHNINQSHIIIFVIQKSVITPCLRRVCIATG